MKFLFASASVIAFAFASSAVAADLKAAKAPVGAVEVLPLFDAYVSVAAGYGLGTSENNGASYDNNGARVQGRATFAVPLAGKFGLQMDGIFGRDWSKLDDVDIKDGTTQTVLAAHAFWRDSAVGAFGLIGQYTEDKMKLEGNGSSLAVPTESYFAGLEGQYFFGNLTLYAQAAYHHANLSYYIVDADGDGFALAGQLRYFVTPDWQLTLKGGYDKTSLTYSGGGTGDLDAKTWLVGLRTDYRFTGTPYSVFAEGSYSTTTFEQNGYSAKDKDGRVLVGVKYNFGTGTLFQRDRSGASFDPFETRGRVPFSAG